MCSFQILWASTKKSRRRNGGPKEDDDDDENKITHAEYILGERACVCECVVYKNAIKILLCSLDLGLSVSHKIYDIERVTLIWTTAQLDNTPNGLFSNFNRLPVPSTVPDRKRAPQFIRIPETSILGWILLWCYRNATHSLWSRMAREHSTLQTNERNVYLASISDAPIATIRSFALNLSMHVKMCEHPLCK